MNSRCSSWTLTHAFLFRASASGSGSAGCGCGAAEFSGVPEGHAYTYNATVPWARPERIIFTRPLSAIQTKVHHLGLETQTGLTMVLLHRDVIFIKARIRDQCQNAQTLTYFNACRLEEAT